MIKSSDILVTKEQYRKIKQLEESHILWSDTEIAKQETKKLPSKFIPQSAKDRNYVMSCFDTWDEYELYRFCQSASTNMSETRSRMKDYD